jgi:hypothetical protein
MWQNLDTIAGQKSHNCVDFGAICCFAFDLLEGIWATALSSWRAERLPPRRALN